MPDKPKYIYHILYKCKHSLSLPNLNHLHPSVSYTHLDVYKRQIYKNGKQELFALNLSSFKTMVYYGNGTKAELYLRTKRDDVIVQTRNDKKGDIDSMGTYLVNPLKNIEMTELNTLSESCQKFNAALVAHK